MSIFSFIKSNLPILNVIQEYTTLKNTGIYWKGLCPFHSEKTGSFTVSPHKDIYYCFGCQMGGDVIAFTAKIENLSQIEAAKYLVDKHSIKVPDDIMREAESVQSFDDKNRYTKACAVTAQWCYENLKRNKVALDYVQSRGFNQQAIDKFLIGYFPSKATIKDLLQYSARENLLANDLIEANILLDNKNDLFSQFEERIIFPIKNYNGEFCGFGGRVFKAGDERAKYYNSKENPNFNKGQLLYGLDIAKKSMQKTNEAFIVEGYADCVAMVQAGALNCVATLGTACTADHLKLLNRFVEKIYVVYDGDEAGQKAILRLTELAWNADLEIKVIVLPAQEDPASFLQKYSLEEMLKKSIDIYNFFINSTKKNFGSQPLSEKLNAVKKLTLIINKLQDPVKQGILLQEISREFSIPMDAIKKDFIVKTVGYSSNNLRAENYSAISEIEIKILAASLHNNDLIDNELSLVKNFLSVPIQDMLKKIKKDDDFIASLQLFTDDQKNFAIECYMSLKDQTVDIHGLIDQFNKTNWKKIVHLMKNQINEAEKEHDTVRVADLLKQFQLLKEKFISGGNYG